MALVEKSVLVGHAAERMYALVDDVERYPEFLPWCGGARVELRDGTLTRAAILIDYRGIKQSFKTENRAQPPERIEIRLVSGPFRQLDGLWLFTSLSPEACKIEFRLHYEFSNRLLEKLVGPVFKHIANTLLEAFLQRAAKLYRR
ncbi:MAG TPA: type II toxin-antitoxin system RatA family toxin [Burkholderiales bacterium]|nr:type II toxin-antitoxin system RatA family toxin [Burkholderiales bacterium]